MKKRLLAWILVLMLAVTLLPTAALAEDAATSGNCGATGNESDVTWKYENGTLTISGTGAMADYGGWRAQPWAAYADQITKFVVEDGVTNIGAFATNGENKIEEYVIGKDVATIGTWGISADAAKTFSLMGNTYFKVIDGALLSADGTELYAYPGGMETVEEYVIPSTVTTILGGAFNGADMRKLFVPSSVTSFPSWSFQGCKAEYIDIDAPSIPGYIFTNHLSELKELRIGANVKIIDRHAFGFGGQNPPLEKVTFDSETLPVTQGYGSIFTGQNRLTMVDLSHCSEFEGNYRLLFKATNSQMIGFYFNTAESQSRLNGINEAYPKDNKVFDDNAVFAVLNGGIIPSWEGWYSEDFKLVTPVQDGCKFIGWYKDADFNTPLDEGAPVSGQTYYAKWTDSVDEIPGKDEGKQMAVDLGSAVYGDTPSATVLFEGSDELKEVKSDRNYFNADIDGMRVTITPKTGLQPGTYTDTLYVHTENGAVHFITVTLTVTPKPEEQEADAALSGVLAAITGTNPFSDVPGSAYYNAAVRWAVRNGIASGTDAKHFSPDAACTRAQAVTFLWRAAGSPAPALAENPFTDVKPSDYCYDAVLWAVENGIAKGTSASTFSPDAACTRGQIVTFLYRAAGSPAGYANSGYTDVPETSYCAAPVAWAVALRITSGTGTLTFSPDDLCTRGQIVTFLYRANA